MPDGTNLEILVGAKLRQDRSVDSSRGLRLMKDKTTDQEKPRVPENWTTLYHGTNLARTEWEGKAQTLDEPTLRIGGMGLSVITEEDKLLEKQHSVQVGREGAYDTTSSYASHTRKVGTSREAEEQEAEIRIIFPAFHSRTANYRDVVNQYTVKYGEANVEEILRISNEVHWRNHHHGLHPLVPRGMVLQKLADTNEGNRRILIYVPQALADTYRKELDSQHITK